MEEEDLDADVRCNELAVKSAEELMAAKKSAV